VSDGAVQSVVNNQLAASAGAGRAALASMDRAGVSRGAGQRYRADMAEAAADVGARSSAADTEMKAAAGNAQARSAFDYAMRDEQLSNSGLLANLRDTSATESLASRSRAQAISQAMRRGQFGLDSIYLDTTPLVSSFFRD
jgi:hypothetical protein